MQKCKMILDMQGYWAIGCGKGGGSEVDNRIDRDADGLPYIPGKMLKGLIKDACLHLKACGNANYNFVDVVFGTATEGDGLNRTLTSQGKIYISDARLSVALRSALSQNEAARQNLTRNIYSTAIDDSTGTAKEGSLRGIEVAVPMRLESHIECDCSEAEMEFIKTATQKLVNSIGAHKTRGLGEVVFSFENEV